MSCKKFLSIGMVGTSINILMWLEKPTVATKSLKNFGLQSIKNIEP